MSIGRQQPQRFSDADESAKLISGKGGSLRRLTCLNPNFDQVFIHMYDAKAASDVNVGTTEPVYTFIVPAGADNQHGAFDENLAIGFEDGIAFAITTGVDQTGALVEDCILSTTHQ